MAGDLHTHTTLSDGSTPVERMAFLAKAAGLTSLAISDHDSIDSVRYAYAHPNQLGVDLIPATELTAYDYERQHRVHILCYWPDDCAALQAHCQTMADRRNEAVRKSCAELEEICPQFRTEDAIAYSRDGGVLYKAHVMRVLMDWGLADNIYGDLYHELFSLRPVRGKILHNPKYETVDTILELIQASRGVAVFAHPSVYDSMPLVRQLVAEGRIDGLEIEHPRNSPEDKEELRRLAEEHNLIITGGTDYHGMNTKRPHPIGTCQTTEEAIARIAALAASRKQ